MHLTPLKRCAHWTVNSKINSAWKGSYLCFWWQTLSDGCERCNQSLLFHHYHTPTPNNLSLYSPSSFLLSQEVPFLPSMQLYKYQSQPQKTGVYPDESKQKTALKSIAEPVHGMASTDLRVMQWQGQGMECTEYSYPMSGTDGLWRCPRSCSLAWWGHRAHCPVNSLLPRDIGIPLPSTHLNHHDFRGLFFLFKNKRKPKPTKHQEFSSSSARFYLDLCLHATVYSLSRPVEHRRGYSV